jgi:hypothetical protein
MLPRWASRSLVTLLPGASLFEQTRDLMLRTQRRRHSLARPREHAHVHARTHTYTRAHTRAHTRARTRAHTHACTRTYTRAHTRRSAPVRPCRSALHGCTREAAACGTSSSTSTSGARTPMRGVKARRPACFLHSRSIAGFYFVTSIENRYGFFVENNGYFFCYEQVTYLRTPGQSTACLRVFSMRRLVLP